MFAFSETVTRTYDVSTNGLQISLSSNTIKKCFQQLKRNSASGGSAVLNPSYFKGTADVGNTAAPKLRGEALDIPEMSWKSFGIPKEFKENHVNLLEFSKEIPTKKGRKWRRS